MARKHSGEIVTRTIRQRQKNGDIYVIERKTQYDPEKKYNVVLSSKIVGKIPLGQNQVVPTRPKRHNRKKITLEKRPGSMKPSTRIRISAPPRRSCLWPDTCWQRMASLYRGSLPGSIRTLFLMRMESLRIFITNCSAALARMRA